MDVSMQVSTAIAYAWLTQVPLYEIAAAAKMDHVSVMNAVRQMRLPDRHPTSRVIYPETTEVE